MSEAQRNSRENEPRALREKLVSVGSENAGESRSSGPEEYQRQKFPLADYRFGPKIVEDGVIFRLWAPSVGAAELVLDGYEPIALESVGEGWFERRVAKVGAGQKYRFSANGLSFPDPASRAQDGDSDGWSIVRADFSERRADRSLRPWNEAILCELHVGTATPGGDFRDLTEHLKHFADAGYTAIELMPLGEFPGERNWGYDGVLPFAPDSSYGTPEDLRALVDRAHELGLAVLLDVVYNHFGPIDNYLGHYAKEFFSEGDATPWGAAVNFAHPTVRTFFLENVRMWLADYDFDGLRFDAVHEFRTDAADLFRSELAAEARLVKPNAMLVLENMLNGASWLEHDANGKPIYFDAQWNDDIHHVMRVLLSGDDKGYFRPFAQAPVDYVATALSEGFIRQGQPLKNIDDPTPIGEPSGHLPPSAFVSFVQNHDQIGNQPEGKRLAERLDAERLDFMHFVVMLSPQIPMFFMGEEAHVRTRFPFFGDLKGHLVQEVREGRAEQAAQFFDHVGEEDELPDPVSPDTVEMARLDWDEIASPERQRSMQRFRELADIRKNALWPLTSSRYLGAKVDRNGTAVRVRWDYAAGEIVLVVNPSPDGASIEAELNDLTATTGTVRREGGFVHLGSWSAGLSVTRHLKG